MKKSILGTLLVSGLVLSIGATTASAELSTKSNEAETDVKVNLLKDDGHEENKGDYYKKLAIVWKPTLFDFEGNASTSNFTLNNRHQFKNRQFIAVNDDRREKGPLDPDKGDASKKGNWSLSGKMDNLTNPAGDKLNATLNTKVVTDDLYIYNIGKDYVYDTDGTTVLDYNPKPIDDLVNEKKVSTEPKLDNVYKLKENFSLQAGGQDVKFLTKDKDDALAEEQRGVFVNLGDNSMRILGDSGKTPGIYEGEILWTLAAQK